MKVDDNSVTIEFDVHNPHQVMVPDVVVHEGVEIETEIPGYEFQLTPRERIGKHGTQVYRFIGADLPQMRHIFEGAGVVEVTITRIADAEEPPPPPEPTDAQIDERPPPPRTLQPGEEGYEGPGYDDFTSEGEEPTPARRRRAPAEAEPDA